MLNIIKLNIKGVTLIYPILYAGFVKHLLLYLFIYLFIYLLVWSWVSNIWALDPYPFIGNLVAGHSAHNDKKNSSK